MIAVTTSVRESKIYEICWCFAAREGRSFAAVIVVPWTGWRNLCSSAAVG
jgi:hypothetical protein